MAAGGGALPLAKEPPRMLKACNAPKLAGGNPAPHSHAEEDEGWHKGRMLAHEVRPKAPWPRAKPRDVDGTQCQGQR